MNIYFTKEFTKIYKKLKSDEKGLIDKAVNEIVTNPNYGKPLRYSLKGLRSYRVGDIRVIYRIEGENLYFVTFGTRKNIYKDLQRKY